MKRKILFPIVAAIFTGLVFGYNACSNTYNFNSMTLHGTNVGNPMTPTHEAEQVAFAICSVLNRCQAQVPFDKCMDGVLAANGIGQRLGLPAATYDPYAVVESAETNGTISANAKTANTCVQTINNLSCSDPNVLSAYDGSSSTPFLAVMYMVPADKCGEVFTPPVQQYSCSTKIFLRGVANTPNGPQVSGPGLTYSVSPALPTGLVLDSNTGAISGNPTSLTSLTAYTVTATNLQGWTTQSVLNIKTADGYLVNDLSDAHNVGPGCVSSSGKCTLRAAIEAVNATSSPNVILAPSGTTVLTLGQIAVTKAMDIYGSCDQSTIIDGNNGTQILGVTDGPTSFNNLTVQKGFSNTTSSPAFTITNGGKPTFTVTLNNVVVQNNTFNGAGSGKGGALYAAGSGNAQQVILNLNNASFVNNQNSQTGGGSGGALFFDFFTQSTINNSSFTQNTATGPGGAIYYSGTAISVNQSLFSNNTSSSNAGAFAVDGAAPGIQNFTNDTFYSNTGNGGGALYQGKTMNVTNCTFVKNKTTGPGGGVFWNFTGSNINLWNNIFENNTNNGGALSNCGGTATYISHGNNLSDNVATDCGLAGADFASTVASLGPLQNNGGPTSTMALMPGSPGIAQANPSFCPAVDQRGNARLSGGQCDVGAFESP